MSAISPLQVGLAGHLFEVHRPWGNLPETLRFEFVSQVAVDSQDRVYVLQRVDPPVVVLNRDGEFIDSWGSGAIRDGHGIAVAHNDLVWIADRDAHQVLGFTLEGAAAFVLGERHRPQLGGPFNHPTDVAVGTDGRIFVSDGYGNSLVHQFSAEGEYAGSFGARGQGPGEFSTPHGLWVDKADRVLVADRENNRVQIFTTEGGFLEEWRDLFHPMDIYCDSEGTTYVCDQTPRVTSYDPSGVLTGRCRPSLYGAHGIWGDSRGDLYLAEPDPMNRLTKLVHVT
jgi:peptidylglycine monooxygenase